MNTPFAIGSETWPGISKLIEEAGEVLQVAGKIVATGGEVEHWDGTNLKDRLEEELGDLCAAIVFVVTACDLDEKVVGARSNQKFVAFSAWHDEQTD